MPTLSLRHGLLVVSAVALGGALGTWGRLLSTSHDQLTAPTWLGRVPWGLLVINAIGTALATWALQGPFRGHSSLHPPRLFVITGFLGGLTSYSGLFVALHAIWRLSPAAAIVTGLTALGSGVVGAIIGLLPWRPS